MKSLPLATLMHLDVATQGGREIVELLQKHMDTLKATIAPVAGEKDLADNSVTVEVEAKRTVGNSK